MSSNSENSATLSKNEGIKSDSRQLRGSIMDDLADSTTGAVTEESNQLLKFHGLYMQDDRDLRRERRKAKLEKAFSFMIRVAVPGGVSTPEQYLLIDQLADERANGSIRLTTRQAYQLHGILKGDIRPVVQGIDSVLLTSLAACGDVNRNVMADPNPDASQIHAQVLADSKAVQKHLLPKTKAYHEIWIDGELAAGGAEEEEPIYGKTYLPRKFKIGFAVPPNNGIDVYSQDLGFIAIVEDDQLVGYNVTAGGGMGRSHGKEETFPRLADSLGFITPDQVIAVAEATVTTQRDFGDRTNRKHARLKYTIEDRGVAWFKGEVEKRSGVTFQPARNAEFTRIMDDYGWKQAVDGSWLFSMFIQNGRIKDTDTLKVRTALREIAQLNVGEFRLSPTQNMVIGAVPEDRKAEVDAILKKYGLDDPKRLTGLRLNSMACVALPTCGLALAESERYLPTLVDELETVLDEAGLRDDEISIRMTGCPNGCARPYLAEIGLVGKAPNKYQLYLGAKYEGTRLNKLYKEVIKGDEVVGELKPIIDRYAKERSEGERFGDFCVRAGIV